MTLHELTEELVYLRNEIGGDVEVEAIGFGGIISGIDDVEVLTHAISDRPTRVCINTIMKRASDD